MLRDTQLGDRRARVAAEGARVSVVYVGRLHATGKRFDHCSNPNKPFQFVLGTQSVVDGFDRAVVGMRVGGVRQVIVPPNLAYGDEGAKPKIPPRAVLVFEIRLLDVEDAATSLNKKPGHVVKKDDRKARRQGKKPGGAPGQRRKRQVR